MNAIRAQRGIDILNEMYENVQSEAQEGGEGEEGEGEEHNEQGN